MQVKYGSDFSRAHALYFDPKGSRVTLMFGVHDDMDLFVAVDPLMHSPTWFSSSIEFKTEQLEHVMAVGWHGWERERREPRRHFMPLQDLRTEAILGVRKDHFLRYVLFERASTGLDPGERLLLADRTERELAEKARRGAPPPSADATKHALEEQLGLSAREILDLIGERFRLAAAVRGGVAEHHLERYLRSDADITTVERLDKDGQPDFQVRFRERRPLVRIECKNVLRRSSKAGPRVDFQKTRASKKNPCNRYYAPGQFEILAACLHPVSEKWEFRFRETVHLAPHEECPGKLSQNVNVVEPPWTASLREILDRLTG
jgi:hypothetical protein